MTSPVAFVGAPKQPCPVDSAFRLPVCGFLLLIYMVGVVMAEQGREKYTWERNLYTCGNSLRLSGHRIRLMQN